jgi:L-rhamnose mutarotase
MKTYCFALDLYDDPALMEEYKRWHRLDTIWPEVLEQIKPPGIVSEEIYLAGNRMFMIVTTSDDFSLDSHSAALAQSAVMQKWEELMWKYQKPLPFARPGQKWVPMEKIFGVR